MTNWKDSTKGAVKGLWRLHMRGDVLRICRFEEYIEQESKRLDEFRPPDYGPMFEDGRAGHGHRQCCRLSWKLEGCAALALGFFGLFGMSLLRQVTAGQLNALINFHLSDHGSIQRRWSRAGECIQKVDKAMKCKAKQDKAQHL